MLTDGPPVASLFVPRNPVLHEWILPLVLLLLACWASGRLFVAPMPAAPWRSTVRPFNVKLLGATSIQRVKNTSQQ